MSQLSEELKDIGLTSLGWLPKLIIEQVIAKYVFPIFVNTKYGKYKISIEKIED